MDNHMKIHIPQYRQRFSASAVWSATLAAAFCVLLGGCTVGPKYHIPANSTPPAFKESPTQFKETDGWTVAQPSDTALRGKWWKIYNDPELNRLEEQLNIGNQNIRQAVESFMEARALVRETRSQYFPTVGTNPTYTRSQSSANTGGAVSAANGGLFGSSGGTQVQQFSLPASVSWEPDLWGRVRNAVHASQFNAQLSAADLENIRLSAQGSLALDFFLIRGQDALQKVLDDTVAADKNALDLAQASYDTGVGDQISVVEAKATLQSTQATAVNIGVARAQDEHAIALLLGKPASEFSLPIRPIITTPPPIPIGVPSQLLERRPDIAAAERTMAAANAQIGVADAAFYPSLTLSASGGLESSTIGHLLDWPSRFWSIGPSVSETIFDGGLRRATVNQYIATYNADLAGYRESVLTAFQQVEDYLAAVRILSRQIQLEQQAVASAQTSLTLELGRYQTGIDPYMDVVIAQTTLLTDQQNLANAQIEQMTDSVQLIEALGGGWDRSQLPTPEQVTRKPLKADTTIQR
jgi:NodT family efflux transporter outer membrane factor (OMF) lipoprotein